MNQIEAVKQAILVINSLAAMLYADEFSEDDLHDAATRMANAGGTVAYCADAIAELEDSIKQMGSAIQPPVVIEIPTKDRTIWLLSFGGSNPQEDECIELTESQCFWLEEKIMSISPGLLEHAKKIQAMAQTRKGRMSPQELREIEISFAKAVKDAASCYHRPGKE